jgi:hypothetical protein
MATICKDVAPEVLVGVDDAARRLEATSGV